MAGLSHARLCFSWHGLPGCRAGEPPGSGSTIQNTEVRLVRVKVCGIRRIGRFAGGRAGAIASASPLDPSRAADSPEPTFHWQRAILFTYPRARQPYRVGLPADGTAPSTSLRVLNWKAVLRDAFFLRGFFVAWASSPCTHGLEGRATGAFFLRGSFGVWVPRDQSSAFLTALSHATASCRYDRPYASCRASSPESGLVMVLPSSVFWGLPTFM